MRALAALLVATSLAAPSRAQGRDLDLSPALDGALFGVGLVGTLVFEFGKDTFAPDECKWCHRQPDGSVLVNGFDRAGREALAGALFEPKTWKTSSDLWVFALLPSVLAVTDLFAVHDGSLDREWATDLAIAGEAVFLAATFNQLVKVVAGRERPFVAYDAPWAASLRSGTEGSADDNLSFYSGHASAAAAMTTAIARIVQLRTGKTWGYWALVPLGALAAVMRMGADKHWASDVLTGLAVGAAAGLVVPSLHAQ